MELIKVTVNENDEQLVSGRELHEFLEVGTQYTKWVERMVSYGFQENIDYIIHERSKVTSQGNVTFFTNHSMTTDMAMNICRMQRRNDKASEVYRFLSKKTNKEKVLVLPKRKEIEFGLMLENILSGISEVIKQKKCFGYRLDFYLPDFNLAIEYDEYYHKYKEKEDKAREKIIFDELKCKLIRVKEGNELEGVNKIIKTIMEV